MHNAATSIDVAIANIGNVSKVRSTLDEDRYALRHSPIKFHKLNFLIQKSLGWNSASEISLIKAM